MANSSRFVPHIAGLRGLAVLLVLGNHFGVPGFDAGFIGVDIFFVISGFLITGILVDEYSKSRDRNKGRGSISLKHFYLRRARRILPASIAVTLVIVVFSWFVNNSYRLQAVTSDAIWSTFFSANLNFAFKSTDYFQIGASPSPFQHFWSLAVEEQFYFIWPSLILAALSVRAPRIRGKRMRWMARLSLLFWFTTLSSLALMVVTLYYQPSLSYFLTSSRAWELSAGALVAIAVRADKSALNFIKSRIFQYLPFPLLIVSLILVRAENFGYTMPLVIFASIILVSKPTDSTDLDVKLLSGKAIRFMGNISYSLYLWHWPVITFGTELGYADSLLEKLALAALSLALAILSYYFIELKAQKIDMSKFLSDKSVRLPRALRIGTSIALLLAVLVIPSAYAQPSVQSYVASHFKAPETDSTPSLTPTPTNTAEVEEGDWLARRQTEIRNSNSAIAAAGKLSDKQISEINRVSDGDSYATGFDFTCSWGECTLGSPNAKTRILLIGDSHALMYQSTLSYLNRIGTDLFVKSIIQAECANVSGSRSLSKLLEEPKVAKCEKHHQTVLSHVNSITTKYDWVVLSDSTIFEPKHYVQDALDFANRVKVAGKETIVLGQAPVNKDLSICLDKDYSNYTDCSGSKPSSLHDYQVAKEAKVGYADLGALFCLQNYCPLIIGDSPTMSRGHITDVAGIQLAPYFMEMLNDSKIPVK